MARPTSDPLPLCIELDGALLANPVEAELLAHELSVGPVRGASLAARSILRGPSHRASTGPATLDADLLPRRPEVEALIASARAGGRRTVLLTPAHVPWADRLAGGSAPFDEVMPLAGTADERADRLCERFGKGGFDYVGATSGDAAIWKSAASVTLIGSEALAREARTAGAPLEQHFPIGTPDVKTWRRALRLHQWLKNVLVAAPALAAHALGSWTMLRALLAFAAFSLCASAVYLMNDLADLASDRAHPIKRARPMASGALPLSAAMGMVPLLLVAAGAVAFQVGPRFALHLGLYFAATVAYTFVLKRWAVVDVLCLAGLYVQRLLAGSVATQVPISPWFGAFAMFLFLGLALVKRAAELARTSGTGNPRRGYRAADLPMVTQLGTASSFAAVVVLALYLQSPTVAKLYAAPMTLWALCPLALFWQARIWLLTGRGEMSDDPVLFAAKDRVSYAVLILAVLIVVLAA